MNVVCLIIWMVQLIYGIVNIINEEETSSFLYVLAVLGCILNYIEKIIN